MSQPFIGEIQLFGFNFNPFGWAFCNGATLPVSQNTELFKLIGKSYGGNGLTTFQLPNFAGRASCGQGPGPGLTPRLLGETFGAYTVALRSTQFPSHSHSLSAFTQPDPSKQQSTPAPGSALATPGLTTTSAFSEFQPNTTLSPFMISPSSGSSVPHENQQPHLAVNFCIALQGTVPSFT